MGSGYESFMKNRYWILRHGKSIPNQRGLIVSSLENGVLEEYQLAADGIDQARLAGQLFLKAMRENNIGLENVRICYSPFSRTTHTAKVVASLLNIPFEGPQCKYESSKLRHDGPGLLSMAMAMADRDERGSLFSITFKADHHLDRNKGGYNFSEKEPGDFLSWLLMIESGQPRGFGAEVEIAS